MQKGWLGSYPKKHGKGSGLLRHRMEPVKVYYQTSCQCGQLHLSLSGEYWMQNNVQLSQMRGTEDEYLFINFSSIID